LQPGRNFQIAASAMRGPDSLWFHWALATYDELASKLPFRAFGPRNCVKISEGENRSGRCD